jgi:hypothetical protein
MSFIKNQMLALGVAVSVLALAGCASESSGSGANEQSTTEDWWRKPPPDYNRGPVIRNNP